MGRTLFSGLVVVVVAVAGGMSCFPVGHIGGNPSADGGAGSGDLAGVNDLAVGGGGSGGDGGSMSHCAQVPSEPIEIRGHITADQTLGCDHVYLMSGLVFVDEPATLTIEKGTTIQMSLDGSLLIAPGAKLMAVGSADEPIVFTSSKLPGTRSIGEWGTVAIVGRAPGNWGIDGITHTVRTKATPDANGWPNGTFPLEAGGSDWADSSGTLKYVRFEYGGAVRSALPESSCSRDCVTVGPNCVCEREMLGLYGVGSGTALEYIDIRRGNFECMFAEGGAFTIKHALCQHSGNGGFGFTRGNRSKGQFLFDQERPDKAAEGIGVKGPFDGNTAEPRTQPLLFNVTVCGTAGSPATVKDPYALFMNRLPVGRIYNFIGWGFHAGLAMVKGGTVVAPLELHSAILFNNFDVNTQSQGIDTNIAYPQGLNLDYKNNDTDMTAWFNNSQWNNSQIDPQIDNCKDAEVIRAMPPTAITANAAPPPDDGFFDPSASFIGAFRDPTDAWATGNWVVWSDN
jgi:hypothetical protein